MGRDIKCYVPTHSLINYTKWQIVSPEASLASMESMDGYIAQVWTGTSRSPNYYRGVLKERVFESAFLEYGCMASMTAPTGRTLWFLTDPIEDGVRDWEDYRRNYQATFTAQLLYLQVDQYEIMPWPSRIYERLYPVSPGSAEKSRIPAHFATMMQVMTNALQQMPKGETLPSRYGVLMANSLMFQNKDRYLSDFFGLALPLLKKGQRVGMVHMENLGYEKALDGVEVLLLTYSNMKPLDPQAHQFLADWVKRGGILLYCGTDTDPFQTVPEWWNTGENNYAAPADHLFERMGIAAGAPAGTYPYGKGRVGILRQDPKDFVLAEGGEKPLLEALESLDGPVNPQPLRLQRGPYRIVAALDEGNFGDLYEEGCLIDLYDPALPVYEKVNIPEGTQALFYDVEKAGKAPRILAAASRAYEEKKGRRSFSYICKAPAETWNVTRILLPAPPTQVLVNGEACQAQWDPRSKTVFLRFPNNPDGVKVEIGW